MFSYFSWSNLLNDVRRMTWQDTYHTGLIWCCHYNFCCLKKEKSMNSRKLVEKYSFLERCKPQNFQPFRRHKINTFVRDILQYHDVVIVTMRLWEKVFFWSIISMEKIRFWAESITTFTSLFLSTLLENNLHEIFFSQIQSLLRVE